MASRPTGLSTIPCLFTETGQTPNPCACALRLRLCADAGNSSTLYSTGVHYLTTVYSRTGGIFEMSRQNPNAEHASCTEMPIKSEVHRSYFHPKPASNRLIHDGEVQNRSWTKGQNNVNRITLKPGTTQVQVSQKVESRRGRPLCHAILTWTCWIDPTFCQKLTRYDSLGTEEILILSPIPFRATHGSLHLRTKLEHFLLTIRNENQENNLQKCVLLLRNQW